MAEASGGAGTGPLKCDGQGDDHCLILFPCEDAIQLCVNCCYCRIRANSFSSRWARSLFLLLAATSCFFFSSVFRASAHLLAAAVSYFVVVVETLSKPTAPLF